MWHILERRFFKCLQFLLVHSIGQSRKETKVNLLILPIFQCRTTCDPTLLNFYSGICDGLQSTTDTVLAIMK